MTDTAPPTAGAVPNLFLVAHRAGNRLEQLRACDPYGVRLAEADVRLFRGRLEIRHLKRLGPLPFLWDRWTLQRRPREPFVLEQLLEATTATSALMLDLKGVRPLLGRRVAAAIAPLAGERAFTVCSRSWRLLEPFRDLPVRRVHSVGSRRQLRALLRLPPGEVEAISIHERLVDEPTATRLRELASFVLTWPVNDLERARALARLGVSGMITDRVDVLAPAAA